ncbi:MAG: tRNA (adenosine(37)-N6)-threonylcarbamoyltransferase complex ATPase subunit type 1 TsaE, partial [Chloroflexi bacterium]
MEFFSHNVEQTEQVGRSLGALLAAGDVIALSGDLGAGKTAFTRGIGAGWGAGEAVTSPTFTLMHEHHRPQDDQVLYHVDCYRLTSLDDAWGIGLEDLLYGQHPVVLEWAENIQEILPSERLWIQIAILDAIQRQVRMTARG